MKTEVQKLPKSEVEITGELPAEDFERHRSRALKNLSKTIDLPGFRKGHMPENVLLSHIGETGILEEMAELALAEKYPEILRANEIDAIGHPAITLTKLARGNPLGFKIRTAIMPKITLPDYENIARKEAQKKEEVKVEDKEVENAIMEIRKLRAGQKPGGSDANVDESPLPAIDDEFAKSLGAYKNLDELKEKIRENILAEKGRREQEKTHTRILGAIVAKTEGEIPAVLVERELHGMIEQFKTDVAGMGITFEQYLAHSKKTEEEIHTEWLPRAEDRVKGNLALEKIAQEKNIVPEKEAVEKETKHLLDHYADADPDRTRAYVEKVLTNKKVFEMLEKE